MRIHRSQQTFTELYDAHPQSAKAERILGRLSVGAFATLVGSFFYNSYQAATGSEMTQTVAYDCTLATGISTLALSTLTGYSMWRRAQSERVGAVQEAERYTQEVALFSDIKAHYDDETGETALATEWLPGDWEEPGATEDLE